MAGIRFARLGAAVLLAGMVLLHAPGFAADSPVAGTWKVTVIDLRARQAITLGIVGVEVKDNQAQAKLVAEAPRIALVQKATLEDVRADGKSLHFTIKGPISTSVAAYPVKGDDTGKRLQGTIRIRSQYLPVVLEKTSDKEIAPDQVIAPAAGFQALRKVREAKDDNEAATMLQDIARKEPGTPVALAAAEQLVQTREKAKADAAELKSAVELWLREASAFGPELANFTRVQAAQGLLTAEKGSALALELARQAEKELTDKTPLAQQADVLKLLASALKKNGKADEVKALDARLAKIDEQLDKEFEKNAVPFKPDAFAGRKGKSERTAVVELFTGAQCPPCVAADVAFDAVLKAYQPKDVVLLQYHLHIPGPDPLTNKATEARAEYYGVESTPQMFLNGKATSAMGGPKQFAEMRYGTLKGLIDEALEKEAGAAVKLELKRQGDKLDIKAVVDGLAKPGDKVKLRLVLVEDVVRYQGNNGQRLHHHIVRAFPGGIDGLALKDKTATQNVTVLLGDVRKDIQDYLEKAHKERPFHDDDRPLDLKKLKVVALVQNDDTKEIVQAAQADVPE